MNDKQAATLYVPQLGTTFNTKYIHQADSHHNGSRDLPLSSEKFYLFNLQNAVNKLLINNSYDKISH